MRLAFLGFLLSALLLTGCAAANKKPVASSSPIPSQLPDTVRPLHYAVSITPDALNLRFAGHAAVDINVLKPTDSITLNALELDFAETTLRFNPGRLQCHSG